jgi:predicted nucleic acid-binding protein
MDFVVVDTDVASNIHKDRLSGPLAARLIGKTLAVTFVTIGELTQWVELRRWGPHRRAELDAWLSGVVELGCEPQVARTWGRLSAAAVRRGRPRPTNDMWIAACCLTHGLALATLNVKDYEDFAEHHGLELITG